LVGLRLCRRRGLGGMMGWRSATLQMWRRVERAVPEWKGLMLTAWTASSSLRVLQLAILTGRDGAAATVDPEKALLGENSRLGNHHTLATNRTGVAG